MPALPGRRMLRSQGAGCCAARGRTCSLASLRIAGQARAVLEALSSLAARLRTSDRQASARRLRQQLRASRFALPYLDCWFATRAIIWYPQTHPAFRRKNTNRRSIIERDLSTLLTAEPRGSSRA
jgi:hypothetical protein